VVLIYIYLIKSKYTGTIEYTCRKDSAESALIRINVNVAEGWKSRDENQKNEP